MSDPVQDAEKAIARILRDLEVACDSIVRGITFDDVDLTCVDDDRRYWNRTVRVSVERRPGIAYWQADYGDPK